MAMGTASYYNFNDPRNKGGNDRIINGVDGNGFAPGAAPAPQPAWNPATFQPANDPLHPLLGQAPANAPPPNQGGWVNGAGQALPAAQPAPQPAPVQQAAPGGGGDLMSQLIAQLQGYDPNKAINDAFDAQSKLAAEAAGVDWNAQQAARGLTPGDNSSQDLHAQLVARLMGPLAAQRAQALAGAQGDKLGRMQSLAGMQLDQQRQAQQQAWQQAQDAENTRRWNAEQAARQGETSWQHEQAAQNAAWQQKLQGWQAEDRTRQNQLAGLQQQVDQRNLQQQLNPATPVQNALSGYLGVQPQASQPFSTGTSNGGETFQGMLERLGQGGGAGPTTSTGMPMGGGGGLAGGAANPGSSGLDPNTAAFRAYQERNKNTWGGGTTTNPTPPPGSVPRPGTTPTGGWNAPGSTQVGSSIGSGIAGAGSAPASSSPAGYVTPTWKPGGK